MGEVQGGKERVRESRKMREDVFYFPLQEGNDDC